MNRTLSPTAAGAAMRALFAGSLRACARRVARSFGAGPPWTLAASRRRRLERATRLTLHSLDARTLRDLGIDRSEIPYLAAEVANERIARIADRSDEGFLP